MRFADVEHEIQVPCIQGSFLFIRMAALQQVGLFDEAFFMYLEDFDLCRRIGATYRNFYFPGAVIYHEFARGSHKNLRLTWYHIQSAIHYFSKYGWFLDNYRVRSNETIKQSQTRQAA
jgi:GT2 family glycosyltransferase